MLHLAIASKINSLSSGSENLSGLSLVTRYSYYILNAILKPSYKKLSDDELVYKISLQEEPAFECLFDRYSPLLLGYCTRILNNKNLAEEILQELWIRVCSSSHNYNPQNQCKAWLLSIARNLCISHYRKKQNQEHYEIEDNEIADLNQKSILDILSEQQDKNIVLKAIENLPEQQRICFMIWTTEEKSYEEIASLLNISIASVKSLLFRAKQNLIQHIGLIYE